MQIFKNDWGELLEGEMQKPYYRELRSFLIREYRTRDIHPGMYEIFNALHYTSFAETRVVLLGQDPYHGRGQAHGLSFSVQEGVPPPPSLLNIYKELETDIEGFTAPSTGCLIPWAEQGVLLLNTVLTVRDGAAFSHRGQGWETFTDAIIRLLAAREKPLAFILWGRNARDKKAMIPVPPHFIVESAHPSPLSANRGFFGSRPFSKVNSFLKGIGEREIDWRL
ncbi:uracil-DNA glycosylase [Selenomonas sp. TAMA-11512]|uniref:uracil-DNA glycosylase n=1 Tax=Selenomonas sp. TAMA-11512 TaxID=3095337 RepID=UPI003092C258|nr:uracil-DNA glycosylase [Selenomonas sp. TAMA-11512]